MLFRFLAACRFLLVVPVVGCVLLTFGVVLMGAARIVTAAIKVVQAGDASAKAAKTMSLVVIEIIGVIVAALAVAFLGHAAVDEASALLNYGGGIALVIIALAFFMNYGNKKSAPTDGK